MAARVPTPSSFSSSSFLAFLLVSPTNNFLPAGLANSFFSALCTKPFRLGTMRLATATILVLLSSPSELVSALPSSRPKQRSVLVRRTKCQARSAAPGDGLPAPSSPPAPPEAPPVNRGSCFPSLDFQMPEGAPSSSSIDSWWCDPNTEYGFLGISYSVSSCLVDATSGSMGLAIDRDSTWEAKLGVHALIWFGFEGGNAWMSRRDTLFDTLRFNPKARFVTRATQFGSEPLFDSAIMPRGWRTRPVVSKPKSRKEKLMIDTAADLGWFSDRTGGKKKVILSQRLALGLLSDPQFGLKKASDNPSPAWGLSFDNPNSGIFRDQKTVIHPPFQESGNYKRKYEVENAKSPSRRQALALDMAVC
ncbi:hypothetical protein BKA70DRAFT_1222110 [Coprinopsis sp. MPI-PUGE-AT-0042]|nr:hypothetical protein BKA70DRAFT_1222110 [Coprinopsis sp. MPI-PUGE-AT-0042]